MNFNAEMENELKNLHLGGKVVKIDQKDRGTPDDWSALEKRIAYCTEENEKILFQSRLFADNSILG